MSSTVGMIMLIPVGHFINARPAAAGLSVRVSGNQLVEAGGGRIVLRGVNRSGSEYACVQGWGVFDGPSDLASVQAMAAWHANIVRVPLNEDCWLGINGVNSAFAGANYQRAISNYVSLLNSQGLYVILELHWSGPGGSQATGQNPMPDRDHSPSFWSGVATAFRSKPAVIFGLFNEPYPDNNSASSSAWSCLQSGGSCSGVGYTAAGMQELVSSVRNTGATNVILVPGVQYTNTLDQWLSHKPNDPTGQLAASFHGYDFNICTSASCWNSQLAPVALQVPLISDEIGETDGTAGYVNGYMAWADSHNVSYLGWTWDTWGCGNGAVLIADYSGTPCAGFGAGFRSHLLSVPPATPAPPPTPPPGVRGIYGVDGFGALHPGSSPRMDSTQWSWAIARGVALRADGTSGYNLDGWGGVHPFGGAPAVLVSAYWQGWDVARSIVVRHDGASGYVLDGWGGVHPYGGAPEVQVSGYWPGWDIAHSLVLRGDGVSGYVLDGWGGLHPFGGAPDVQASAYWQGWDVARGLALNADGASGYVLDGWGGLAPFGNAAPASGSAYWSGWDIARAVVPMPGTTGKGWVLDGWAGFHPYGGAPPLTSNDYSPSLDIVRGASAA